MIDAGLEPLEPYPGSNAKPWRCRCLSCDREVSPVYASIQQGRGGCRECGNVVASLRRRLDSSSAAAVMIDADLEPLEPYPGTAVPWRCRCVVCGHGVHPRYGDVRKSGRGCKWCADKAVDPDEAAAVMIDAGLEPLEPYPGSLHRWGLPRGEVTSEMACFGGPGKMHQCPSSPTHRSSATMS